MKRAKVYVEERRKRILDELKANPDIRVEQLAKILEVSAITIRRDLQYLEDSKMLTRVYGGATLAEQSYVENGELNHYRDQIAKFAAQFISDNDTVFINSSSNALKVLEYIKKENVTVITNNGKAILSNYKVGNVRVTLTGGELQYPKEVLVGNITLMNIMNAYVKKTFVGCSGVSIEKGMTSEILNEVSINQMMINHATEGVYLLADHTKIGCDSSFMSSPVEKISVLITDELAPEEELEKFRKKGVVVYKVKKNEFY